ncbi:MAG TPA: glycosyltransferase 87 family protein [Gaiellaceae bacterium]
MVALSESRPSERSVAGAAFAAVALFVLSWTLLHAGFYKHRQIRDTPVYQHYGNAIADGKMPYRDFELEYPPAALPMFALPGLAEPGHDQDVSPGFRRAFETLMWICGALALCAMAFVLRALGGGAASVWAALAFAALAPLALGSVILSRFDLWPAAIVAAALAAVVWGHPRVGHALLGLGVGAKLYPAVLIPLGVTFVWKRWGRREALVCLGLTVGVTAAIFLPFLALAPGGVWHSVSVQLNRPLQVESLGSALLLAAHHTFGLGVTGETSHGSQNLAGSGADALAIVFTIVQIATLVWIWTAFARGPGGRERFVRACAAALCAFVALGKVLSPQFLIWLIPVVPLVRGRRGLWSSALFLAALVLTQLWFPFRYFRLATDFEPSLSWLLLGRDLVLVALTAILVTSLRRGATRPESP